MTLYAPGPAVRYPFPPYDLGRRTRGRLLQENGWRILQEDGSWLLLLEDTSGQAGRTQYRPGGVPYPEAA